MMREVKQVTKNFEIQTYDRQLRDLVIQTVQKLSQHPEVIKSDGLSRYDLDEVRKFVMVSSLNPDIASEKITQDIEWRNKNLPINPLELVSLIKSKIVLFFGSDRELCPVVYVRPNRGIKSGKVQSGITLNYYQQYFVYILENLLPLLNRKDKFSNKVSILYDIENGDFHLELLELIEDLIMTHYPERLNKIFIVRINLNHVSEKVKGKFHEKFYRRNILLFDEL